MQDERHSQSSIQDLAPTADPAGADVAVYDQRYHAEQAALAEKENRHLHF